MAQYIYYPGTRAEEHKNAFNWESANWNDGLSLSTEKDGVRWVNGVTGIRGLGYRPATRTLVGKPTQGKSPAAWLCQDGDVIWICAQDGYGVAARYYRLRVA